MRWIHVASVQPASAAVSDRHCHNHLLHNADLESCCRILLALARSRTRSYYGRHLGSPGLLEIVVQALDRGARQRGPEIVAEVLYLKLGMS